MYKKKDQTQETAAGAHGERLEWIETARLETLKRNPQYLTPKQMDALKRSIERDGFVAPILVRPSTGDRFEVVSGNHRLMAARELGRDRVPCVVIDLDDRAAQRLAINLNLIHGDPPAELLAPFLAEMDDLTLTEIHLDDALLAEVSAFDARLAATMARLDTDLEGVSNPSNNTPLPDCVCPKCNRRHARSSAE